MGKTKSMLQNNPEKNFEEFAYQTGKKVTKKKEKILMINHSYGRIVVIFIAAALVWLLHTYGEWW